MTDSLGFRKKFGVIAPSTIFSNPPSNQSPVAWMPVTSEQV